MTNTQISHRFDRLGWLERSGHLRKKKLYLDLNFWINLTDPKDNLDAELRELVTGMVNEGRLICPISPSLVVELGKQSDSTRRHRRCQTGENR